MTDERLTQSGDDAGGEVGGVLLLSMSGAVGLDCGAEALDDDTLRENAESLLDHDRERESEPSSLPEEQTDDGLLTRLLRGVPDAVPALLKIDEIRSRDLEVASSSGTGSSNSRGDEWLLTLDVRDTRVLGAFVGFVATTGADGNFVRKELRRLAVFALELVVLDTLVVLDARFVSLSK